MNCIKCHDTGSLSRELVGHLDCAHCDVASEREQLDSWIYEQRRAGQIDHVPSSDAWLIYQRGKAAAMQPA